MLSTIEMKCVFEFTLLVLIVNFGSIQEPNYQEHNGEGITTQGTPVHEQEPLLTLDNDSHLQVHNGEGITTQETFVHEQEPSLLQENDPLLQEHNVEGITTQGTSVHEQEPLQIQEDDPLLQEQNAEGITTQGTPVQGQETLQTEENNPLLQEHNGDDITTPGTHVQELEPQPAQANEPVQQLHHEEGIITPAIHVPVSEHPHAQVDDSLHRAMDECNMNDAGETVAVQVVADNHVVERQEPFICLREDSRTDDIGTFGATSQAVSPQASCSSSTDDIKKATNNGTICNEGMSITYCGYYLVKDESVPDKVLGKGDSGEVNEMQDLNTHKRFARKTVKFGEFSIEEVLAQIAAGSAMPLVPRILQVTVQADEVHIDMELLPDKSQTLSDVMMRCLEHTSFFSLWLYVWERCSFLLSELHRAGYVHNDLNFGNFMVRPDGNIVPIDYGEAKRINISSDSNMTVELDHEDFQKMMKFYLEFKTTWENMTAKEYYEKVHEMCIDDNIDQYQLKLILAEIVASLDITHEVQYPP